MGVPFVGVAQLEEDKSPFEEVREVFRLVGADGGCWMAPFVLLGVKLEDRRPVSGPKTANFVVCWPDFSGRCPLNPCPGPFVG